MHPRNTDFDFSYVVMQLQSRLCGYAERSDKFPIMPVNLNQPSSLIFQKQGKPEVTFRFSICRRPPEINILRFPTGLCKQKKSLKRNELYTSLTVTPKGEDRSVSGLNRPLYYCGFPLPLPPRTSYLPRQQRGLKGCAGVCLSPPAGTSLRAGSPGSRGGLSQADRPQPAQLIAPT